MAKRPANLLYALDDRPPVWICLVLALQHVFFLTSGLIVVSLVMRQVGCPLETVTNIVCLSMIAGGIATILQALPRGPLGSGYLCTEGTDPSFLVFSLQAGAAGGPPLIFGMTFLSGIIECLLARVTPRLRMFLPPEVTGTVLAMVGFNLVPVMIKDFFGVDRLGDPVVPEKVFVAALTLAVMVGVNVWGKGKIRLYSVIAGLAVGYVAACLIGLIGAKEFALIAHQPFLRLPNFKHLSFAFDPALVIPVVVVTLASTLKSVATLTMCQKANDAGWTRPDLDNIAKGTLADGVASMIGGGMGALGKSLYASSVGLSVATGATSRIVAFYTGGLYIALAFLPQLAAVFTIMPTPLMGAAMVFMVTFMVISGIQMITSRMIDTRRTFVIAVSLLFGLSVDSLPALYAGFPPWLKSVFCSSLAVTTLMAVLLNLVMRIGVSKTARLTLPVEGESSRAIYEFMEKQGAAWGARREVVYNAMASMNEFMDSAPGNLVDAGTIAMDLSFDEFNLDVRISWCGRPLEFPTHQPGKAELLTDPLATARLSAFLIKRYADRVVATQDGDACRLDLHFNH